MNRVTRTHTFNRDRATNTQHSHLSKAPHTRVTHIQKKKMNGSITVLSIVWGGLHFSHLGHSSSFARSESDTLVLRGNDEALVGSLHWVIATSESTTATESSATAESTATSSVATEATAATAKASTAASISKATAATSATEATTASSGS